MGKIKKNKASHGRHAAPPADSKVSSGADKQVASTTSAPPQAAVVDDGHDGLEQPPVQNASFQASPAGSPVLPVDASHLVSNSRRHKPLKVLGITFGALVVLLLVAYVGISLYFTDRFMPNSNIGHLNVSLMKADDAEKLLSNAVDDYTLSIEGRGFSLEFTSADTDLSLNESVVIKNMLSSPSPWSWPFEITKKHDETDKLVAEYNGTGFEEEIVAAVEEFNATATQPTNAAIAYNSTKGAFVVEPEKTGTALDSAAVVKAVDAAIALLEPKATITEDELLQPTVLSTDPKLAAAATSANAMITADLELTMADTMVGEVNSDLISQWVRLNENLDASLDVDAMTAWVDELAATCNTIETTRTYLRPDGKEISVSGGVYGWEVDRDALLTTVSDGVTSGTVATVDVPLLTSGTAYNGAGQQDWGARYCDIDLSEQYVRFYDETGALIWESACISGKPDGEHDTPTGVYWLNQKASPSKLIGYDNGVKIYESTVQYWMPFVGNAIGMHDADWQPDFGGAMYANGYGSHGCVNLPPYKAYELYGIIQSGDVVVCHW